MVDNTNEETTIDGAENPATTHVGGDSDAQNGGPETWNLDSLPPELDYFLLFEFSAKLDPVPTMLVQNHVAAVDGFMGQVTAFRKSLLKKHVTVLGMPENFDEVRYIHGNLGRGTFTFMAGHDPEDYRHMVHDPPTELDLHKSSPGYRLILNNVLFPAAKKKERKT